MMQVGSRIELGLYGGPTFDWEEVVWRTDTRREGSMIGIDRWLGRISRSKTYAIFGMKKG